jgi:hypothetical protein
MKKKKKNETSEEKVLSTGGARNTRAGAYI